MKSLLVTGAAGFIGSAFVREALSADFRIVILDALTYAGHFPNIESCLRPGKCDFIKGDIRDQDLVTRILREHRIDGVVNFAAESHVDNSISGPGPFIQTNIVGTYSLLEASRSHYQSMAPAEAKLNFRFLHVSTDEVFGELGDSGYFTEDSPYSPNSPYSASKAASDHLVRAWGHTYKLPVLVTNCSNNYGPRQFPEKLIPRIICCALREQPLPVYGKGENVRDWIHVEDHARGILLALTKGRTGGTYCFGGRSERKNIEVVQAICRVLDAKQPRLNGRPYSELVEFVKDRAGHDWRYAIDDSKAERELGFIRKYSNFEEGLSQTVDWYLENKGWVQSLEAKR